MKVRLLNKYSLQSVDVKNLEVPSFITWPGNTRLAGVCGVIKKGHHHAEQAIDR